MTDETNQADEVIETPVESIVEETQPEITEEEPVDEPEKETTKTELPFETKLTNLSELRSGQTIRVHERIKDMSPKGEIRERIQIFEGMVTGVKGSGLSRTMTIKKISEGGYGVEKIYPINSPVIAKIELVKTAKVRRAKLSFLTNMKRRFERRFKETYIK